ncbi:MAG: respiratory nitrate reductase subunit gamma [Solirubrobacterales bacterium]|nr:respiratory nitrate reductase subunit gamma [Solirubrobacterales bacterium]
MSAGSVLLWVVLPYVAVTIFIVGHVWRYRHDQFGWTSRSTQLLEHRLLAWGSPLFHYGALAAIGGHVLGILIPPAATGAVGIDEDAYHLLAVIGGGIAGAATVVGFLILLYRRATVRRVAVTTSWLDIAAYGLLAFAIGVGTAETLAVQAFGDAFDYRDSVGAWFRSLVTFQPETESITDARLIFQIHAISAWPLYALWPFTRLVHAWSIPLQYIGRPYILYRQRYPAAR